MNEMMLFPDTWEEFEQYYGFTDTDQVYTNGSRLIPSFRVKQWLDHLKDTEPIESRWIPIKTRPMTEEERAYFNEQWEFFDKMTEDEMIMFDCEMPEDGQDIIVCSERYAWRDTCENDVYGFSLEECGDWSEIKAWMPFPEPYGGGL